MTEQAEIIAESVALAREPDFQVGSLFVQPSTRQITGESGSETLEPRVMQVLVALHRADGAIVTQNELIEGCWSGVVVGDNAIHRVISRIRHVATDLGGGSFRVETIAKVGYRLVVEGAEQLGADIPSSVVEAAVPAPATPLRKWTRRSAIAGVVLAGAGLAYVAVNRTVRAGPDPRAKDLYERAELLIETGEGDAARQAIDFYKQAVTIDPDYADAWGALAVGYIHYLDSFGYRERVAAPELARSAAKRALALDPDQPDAILALAIPLPHFRRWLEHEKPLRDLIRRFPDYWYGHAQLGILLLGVGRASEAVERFRRVLELEPMLPTFWLRFAGALDMAGREQEADIAYDQALARWPMNGIIRGNRLYSFWDAKRYAEAVAFLRDSRNIPDGNDAGVAHQLRTAEALASGTGFAEQIAVMRSRMTPWINPDLAFRAGLMVRFRAVDLAFETLEAGYFGGELFGRRFTPPDATAQRSTAPLFCRAILEHRNDQRYASILRRTGLEDYWRKSGTQPDFRKGYSRSRRSWSSASLAERQL